MRDSSNSLRKAYYDVIKALTYNAVPLVVYNLTVDDSYDKGHDFHYVLIKEINSIPFYHNVVTASITVDVVTGFQSGGSSKRADEISSLIMDAIIKRNGEGIDLSADGFNVHITRLAGKVNEFQLSSMHRVYVSTLTIEHNIGQTN
jgi:hypothetical protein